MGRQKRKLTAAEKRAKKKRQQEYETIFVNGRQKRVKRPPTIEGMDADEFIRRNADPIWLHQNGMWEYMNPNGDCRLIPISFRRAGRLMAGKWGNTEGKRP
jgi:hypothetical protein